MTRGWLFGGSLLMTAAGVSGTVGLVPTAIAQTDPVWLKGFAEAQAAAKETGKPIFLVFR
jgi:hypothetical protein